MNKFEQAGQNASAGPGHEIWYFLRESKKWWLLPFVIILVLFGGLMLLSSTAVAPFVYSLF